MQHFPSSCRKAAIFSIQIIKVVLLGEKKKKLIVAYAVVDNPLTPLNESFQIKVRRGRGGVEN